MQEDYKPSVDAGAHPITPLPELVEQWWTEFERADFDTDSLVFVATQAARWGADQELEACCEWMVRNYKYPEADNPLRAARRPKPPSGADQALIELSNLLTDLRRHGLGYSGDAIRAALERLKELEQLDD